MPWGVIDDEAIAEARAMVGTDLPPWVRWVSEANRDSISHYTESIGDMNPLWNDPAYAAGTRWKKLLAPPTFVFAVEMPAAAPGLPGASIMYGGAELTWWDAMKSGDVYDAPTRYTNMTEKSGRFADRWVLQTTETDYVRGDERELVARAVGHTARLPIGDQLHKQEGKYGSRPTHRYTPEELAKIEDATLAEPVRGAEPRYIEDVRVGENLPEVTRGPLTMSDIMSTYAAICGARPYGGTHGPAILYRRRTGQYHVSETSGALEAIGRGHLEPGVGEDIGMGGAYDIGPARMGWAATMVTNWMSDEGFLHKLNIKLLQSNLVGDTTYWTGTVTATNPTDHGGEITIDIKATNQIGDVTAVGTATVLLPTRAQGPVRLPLPRP